MVNRLRLFENVDPDNSKLGHTFNLFTQIGILSSLKELNFEIFVRIVKILISAVG